jgi:hypothetical protein
MHALMTLVTHSLVAAMWKLPAMMKASVQRTPATRTWAALTPRYAAMMVMHAPLSIVTPTLGANTRMLTVMTAMNVPVTTVTQHVVASMYLSLKPTAMITMHALMITVTPILAATTLINLIVAMTIMHAQRILAIQL